MRIRSIAGTALVAMVMTTFPGPASATTTAKTTTRSSSSAGEDTFPYGLLGLIGLLGLAGLGGRRGRDDVRVVETRRDGRID